MYTDAEIMDCIVGSKAMTAAACDVIRSAIALSKTPFNSELTSNLLGNAMAPDCFLPKAEVAQEKAA